MAGTYLLVLLLFALYAHRSRCCDSTLMCEEGACQLSEDVTERTAKRLVKPERYMEGAGFPVNSPIGGRQLNSLDPFLLLHHMGPVKYGPGEAKGAPWHPHRGFVTVTYMLAGEFEHHDSTGASGILRAGDVQWMTAGSGIIHDEVPSKAMMRMGGTMEGFQLWVNLPQSDKMVDPDYQDLQSDKIPEHTGDRFFVRVIAGEAFGKKALVSTKVPIHYLDFHAQSGASFTHDVLSTLNSGAYVYRGKARFGTNKLEATEGEFVEFQNDGSKISVEVAEGGAKFILLAGQPLNEPVAKHGPFVMNTREEIKQAFVDYSEGKLVRAKPKFTFKAEHSTEFDPTAITIVDK